MAIPWGYALGSAGFLLLTILAFGRLRGVAQGSGLPLAFALQAVWCASMATFAFGHALPFAILVGLELSRTLAWAAALALPLSRLLTLRGTATQRLALSLAFTLPLIAWLSPMILRGDAQLVFLVDLQRWSGLLLAIAGLVLVEQFARNARRDLDWELRYLWLGIGLLFAVDLALWSSTLLLGTVDERLQATRGALNLLVGGLLAVALRRLSVPLGPAVLRKTGNLLFNNTLVGAGFYVMLMAAVSVLVRRGGSGAASFVEAFFIGASLVALAVAVFSSQFRAWWRVIVSKKLRPYRYDYRDVWLTLTRDLARDSEEPVRRRVALSLASFVNSGRGQIWERDDSVYRAADLSRRPEWPVSVEHGEFFDFLGRREWVFDLTAWRDKPSSSDRGKRSEELLPAPPAALLANPDTWLVVPLLCNEELVGFATLDRPYAPIRLGWEQLDLLRAAGRQIGSHIAFERAATRLAEMQQFAALNRLSGFVMHDLRHLVAQLALLVDNAARHRRNPEFIDDAILTIDSSVKRMTALMDALKSGQIDEPGRRFDLAVALNNIVQRCATQLPVPRLQSEEGTVEVMAHRERLEQAIEHLVRNAQQATPAEGRVSLTLRRDCGGARIEIADTGCGMDEEFVRTRLFRPFDSTKGQQGMGLGAYEARDIIRRQGGSLVVESQPGRGTMFLITLPLAPGLSR